LNIAPCVTVLVLATTRRGLKKSWRHGGARERTSALSMAFSSRSCCSSVLAAAAPQPGQRGDFLASSRMARFSSWSFSSSDLSSAFSCRSWVA
jgi:hypothetical protein